jgi:hypothetical protein
VTATTPHFDDAVRLMPSLLSELRAKAPAERGAIANLPGVYLLSDNGTPIYVGQSRTLRSRLANHSRPSSSCEQASFAFLLARLDAREAGTPLLGLSRRDTERHPSFAPLFTASKERVARMTIKAIEVDDAITRSLLEMYVTEALALKHNSFETH